MMSTLKNKTVWFYVGASSVIFALTTIIWGLVQPGFARKTFDTLVIVFLALGIAAEIANTFLNFKFMPIIPVLFYAAGFGCVAYHGAPIIMDVINKINFLDGNGTAVIGYIVCTALACVLSTLSCFFEQTK